MEALIFLYWVVGAFSYCAWWRGDILNVTIPVVVFAMFIGWIFCPIWLIACSFTYGGLNKVIIWKPRNRL